MSLKYLWVHVFFSISSFYEHKDYEREREHKSLKNIYYGLKVVVVVVFAGTLRITWYAMALGNKFIKLYETRLERMR